MLEIKIKNQYKTSDWCKKLIKKYFQKFDFNENLLLNKYKQSNSYVDYKSVPARIN